MRLSQTLQHLLVQQLAPTEWQLLVESTCPTRWISGPTRCHIHISCLTSLRGISHSYPLLPRFPHVFDLLLSPLSSFPQPLNKSLALPALLLLLFLRSPDALIARVLCPVRFPRLKALHRPSWTLAEADEI